jgi:hypothetical protein
MLADAAHCASLSEFDDSQDTRHQNHTTDIDGCSDEPGNLSVLTLVGELGCISISSAKAPLCKKRSINSLKLFGRRYFGAVVMENEPDWLQIVLCGH